MTKTQDIPTEPDILPGTDIVRAPRAFGDNDLGAITSFSDALALMSEAGIIPEDIRDYGTGFELLKDKRQLIGVPFAIMQWNFVDGDYGTFVAAMIVTETNAKRVIIDGSTGIYDQLKQVTAERMKRAHATPNAGLLCKGGLTVSDYTYVDDKGESKPAQTFYLAQ